MAAFNMPYLRGDAHSTSSFWNTVLQMANGRMVEPTTERIKNNLYCHVSALPTNENKTMLHTFILAPWLGETEPSTPEDIINAMHDNEAGAHLEVEVPVNASKLQRFAKGKVSYSSYNGYDNVTGTRPLRTVAYANILPIHTQFNHVVSHY